MASIVRLTQGKQPVRAVDYVDHLDDGKRKRLRLGIVSHDDARDFTHKLEKLLAIRRLGQRPEEHETLSAWLAILADDIHARMAAHGLVVSRNPADRRAAPMLGDFLAKHLDQRKAELKPSSIQRLIDTTDRLKAYFGTSTTIDTITPDDAKDWRASMLAGGLSEGTTRLHCRNAKTLFNDAVERELIDRNPFAKLKSSAVAANRDRYVTPEETRLLLDASPNLQWRVLIGLARLAGMRCPSETHSVSWSDVDWARRRLRVPSRKTERYDGKAERFVPIVPELFTILQDAFDVAPEGETRIVTLGDHRPNLHRSFGLIVAKAGLVAWSDKFQALRRSCETEWAQTFPQSVVSEWIGHSVRVSLKHYTMVPDATFNAAAGIDAESAAECAAVIPGTKPQPDEMLELVDCGELVEAQQKLRTSSDLRHDAESCEARTTGLEPATTGSTVRYSTPNKRGATDNAASGCGNRSDRAAAAVKQNAQQLGAENLETAPLDPDLQRIVERWATLPEATRQAIVALAEGGAS